MEGPLFEIDGERLKRLEELMAQMKPLALPKIGLNLQHVRPGGLDFLNNVIVLASTPAAKESRVLRFARGKTRVAQAQAEQYGIKFIPLEMCDRDMQARVHSAVANKEAELKRMLK